MNESTDEEIVTIEIDDHPLENDNELDGPPKKKRKRNLRKSNELKKLHKPPTVEELNRLRETENLFHSNLFRLQIDELLKEVDISSKHKVRIDLWVESFKEWVSKMETSDCKFSLSDLDWTKQWKVKCPFNLKPTTKGWYQFMKPANIVTVGSYASKSDLKGAGVDIAVVMPREFWMKEDHLNGRYHLKRALYLSELVAHLDSKSDLVEKVSFLCDEGKNWSPYLEVIPQGKLNKKTKFFVYLVPDQHAFRISRFAPSRNNVRSKWFYGPECNLLDEICATPFYNNSILNDLLLIESSEFIKKMFEPNMIEAARLLKIWAKQRNLDLGFGGLNGHVISMLLCYLRQIKKIHSLMSSYQVIRTFWNFVAHSEFDKNGITLCTSSGQNEPQLADFHDNFPVVFVDPTGYLNILAGLTKWGYSRLKIEAQTAIKYLDTPEVNSFYILFMAKVSFGRLCDHAIAFHNWEFLEKVVTEKTTEEERLDQTGMVFPLALNCILNVLEKGVGKRISGLFVQTPPIHRWKISKNPPYYQKAAAPFVIGFLLDPEYCFTMVDKASDVDGDNKSFRDFWGDKSELRRFKDGTITEAVVWEAKSWNEKRLITREVVKYLLKTKFGMNDTDYRYVADQLEFVLPAEREENTNKVTEDFDKLAKHLRNLRDIPLEITSVQGISPVFRHSDLYPPVICPKSLVETEKTTEVCLLVDREKHHAPAWVGTAEMQIQLAVSNKWPKDLEAVRRIKAAFYIRIAKALGKQFGLVARAFQEHVIVMTPATCFKLTLAHSGEIPLLKESKTPEGLIQYRDTPESILLEKQINHRPKITSALLGLHSQHNSLGAACCLAKRWLRSHFIDSSHFSDEAVDLLMAFIYLRPEPFLGPPNQPQIAFNRFLDLIANTNWAIECLILNFNQELTKEEMSDIESYFTSNRSTLPQLFIATPYDRNKSLWTKDGPSPVVLLRLVELAKRTAELLGEQLFNHNFSNFNIHFQPSLTIYDVLIDLYVAYCPKRYQSLEYVPPCFPTKEINPKFDKIPVCDFDPVQSYLHDLRTGYGEWCLFFHDSYGGSTIGALWKPGTFVPRDFKVSHAVGRKLEEASGKLVVDLEAMVDDFFLLGHGLVKSIRMKRDGEFHVACKATVNSRKIIKIK